MNPFRVMIIDDEDDVRQLLAVVLRGRYEVVEACDGLDAMNKLETYEPDMAIIDHMMPMMDGYTLCESIRRHPKFGAMHLLFVSPDGSKEVIKKAYAAGANLFMAKPVDPERVMKNLDFTVEHEPPPLRAKSLTIEQIARLEKEAASPKSKSAPEPSRESTPTASPKPIQNASKSPVEPSRAAQQPELAKEDRNDDLSKPASDNVRILAVDDDPDMLQMLDLTLHDDYEVTTACDGVDAIERMVAYEPDILLLDIMMPKMNGYQLLQTIRRNPTICDMPVVVLSAKTGVKDREYAARLGATQFLGKPFSVDELMKVLAEITHAHNFRVRPKRMTMFDISDMLYGEENSRQDLADVRSRKRKYQEIQEVVNNHYDAPPTKRVR